MELITTGLSIGFVLFIILSLGLLLPVIALIMALTSDFRGSNDKLIWVIVILLLPLLGSILFFVIGRGQRMVSAGKPR